VVVLCTNVPADLAGTPEGVKLELQQLQEAHSAATALNKRQLNVFAVRPDPRFQAQQGGRHLQAVTADVGSCGLLCQVRLPCHPAAPSPEVGNLHEAHPRACWLTSDMSASISRMSIVSLTRVCHACAFRLLDWHTPPTACVAVANVACHDLQTQVKWLEGILAGLVMIVAAFSGVAEASFAAYFIFSPSLIMDMLPMPAVIDNPVLHQCSVLTSPCRASATSTPPTLLASE
jgi:hypothetical protein